VAAKIATDREPPLKEQTPSGPGKISRRAILGLGVTAAVGLAGCKLFSPSNGNSTAGQSMTVTSGYIPIVDCTPLVIAYHKGFYKANGLKADKPVLIRGWAPLLEAFTSDQILLTHVLLFQLIFMRYEQKQAVRSIAFNHLNGFGMLGGPGVKSMKDLGGKIVGCPTWWAPHTLLFQECLRKEGLTPVIDKQGQNPAANEVAFRVLAPPDMPNALKTGAIGGAVVSEGFAAASELLADSTLLRMSGDVWRNHPCCQSALMQRTIDKDPSWAQAVTNSIAQACAWSEKNREETVEILAQDGGGYFPLPKKVMERGVNFTDLAAYGVGTGTGAIRHPDWKVERLGFNPYPYASAIELAVQLMAKNTVDPSVALSPAIKALDPKQVSGDLVDSSLIRKAVDGIGGLTQFDGVDPSNPFERKEQYDV
jgi:NitT/TauT family transport system substrate-binding protein